MAAIVVRGEPVVEVVRVFGVAERTVFNWLARYRHGGWGALAEGARNGRPRKVDGKVMAWLYNAVTLGDPRQHQFEFCLWTLAVIRTLLKKTHGIEVSKSSVSRLLAHLGLSPQRPIYRCYKRDPKEIERYLKKTFPEIRKLAKDIGAEIYFVDEAAVRSDGHRGTTWGKIGSAPVVADGGGRFGLKLISAVSPRGDMRFCFVEGRMNSDKFIGFLKMVRQDAGRPVIIIADNASYHTSGKVRAFASDPENGVLIENLPAYAPRTQPRRAGLEPRQAAPRHALHLHQGRDEENAHQRDALDPENPGTRKIILQAQGDKIRRCQLIMPSLSKRLRTLAQRPKLLSAARAKLGERIAERLLNIRPGRSEPKAVKLRPKPHRYLTDPRHGFVEIPQRSKYEKAA